MDELFTAGTVLALPNALDTSVCIEALKEAIA